MRLAILILLPICLLVSCAPTPDFDSSLKSIVRPYQFSIARWELQAIPAELFSSKGKGVEDEAGTVMGYFDLVEQIKRLEAEIATVNCGNKQGDLTWLEAQMDSLKQEKETLTGAVEGIIARQLREVLGEQGIYHPWDNYIKIRAVFPPLIFELEPPPHLLVVSPRDRIESMREVHLKQELNVEAMENIEEQVDELGVSSLVVGLGGLSTYPAFVVDDASLQFTINAAAEEWLHAYLTFKPLGFLYLLDITGISRNYDIATMNETLAGMVSQEIGTMVVQKYYPDYANSTQPPPEEPEFDFNREMREIRRAVDSYLAQGETDQAEELMEQKRQYLASQGYHLRKLNQAYFAFYGTYAHTPTSISPIGTEMKQLRGESTSLKDFLDTVAAMTSRQDLSLSLE